MSNSKYCNNCNKYVNPSFTYCPNCGKKLTIKRDIRRSPVLYIAILLLAIGWIAYQNTSKVSDVPVISEATQKQELKSTLLTLNSASAELGECTKEYLSYVALLTTNDISRLEASNKLKDLSGVLTLLGNKFVVKVPSYLKDNQRNDFERMTNLYFKASSHLASACSAVSESGYVDEAAEIEYKKFFQAYDDATAIHQTFIQLQN